MCDLEDRLLKKNIPGKYTWWEEYDHDDHGGGIGECDDDKEDDEEEAFENEHLNDSTLQQNVRPTTGITGPKGVLADKKLHDELDRLEREKALVEQQVMLERWTRGALMDPGEASLSGAAIEERKRRAKQLERKQEEEEDEELHEFGTKHRQQRLHNSQVQQVREVNQEGFADAIDETPADTSVVVLLYEDHLPDCLRLNRMLEELSLILPAHFLKLKASVAFSSMDPIGLPSVSIYRGGHLIENLTPITLELPKNFEVKHVRMLLERYGVKQSLILSSSSHIVFRLAAKASHPGQLDRESFDFDSDGDGYDGVD